MNTADRLKETINAITIMNTVSYFKNFETENNSQIW